MPPKILQLITRLDTGGSSENVILSSRGLRLKGYEVLVASGPSRQPAAEASRGDFPHVVLPSLVREIRPFSDLRAFFQVRRLLMDRRPDILHTHSSKAGIIGRWAAWTVNGLVSSNSKTRINVIHTPHGHVFYGYFGKLKSLLFVWLERLTARITDTLVAISEGEKREHIELGVGQSGQWVVIHSGVHLVKTDLTAQEARERVVASFKIPKDAMIVGTVARLEPVKGVPVLVEAAARVLSKAEGPPVRFLLVGDGAQESELKARAKVLGILEQIIFAGYQKDTLSFMRAMDIYVQPSLNEGMGKTLIMAQLLGLPIVASKVCGIPDVVRDGAAGILVPSADPNALADAILKLIEEPELRIRFGRNGSNWILEKDSTGNPRFSHESMVAQLEKLYLQGS